MLNKIKKYLPLLVLIIALPAVGLGCRNNVTPKPITLEYWRVFDNSDALDEVISAYRATHPHVTINVKKFRFEEYEQEILEALAEDRGPDIFSIHNTWIGKYESKIEPLPPTTTTIEQSLQSGVTKKVVSEEVTKKSLTTNDVSRGFVDVVAKDVIRNDSSGSPRIWGLPLGVDTLVMFYNRDILNRADIATAPDNWNDFLQDVSKITRLDNAGNIIVGGAALGTADNIIRFSDILSVLMMQNGAIMTNAANQATFHLIPNTFTSRSFVPGIEALRFYTDFAQPTKNAYSWNNDMPDSLEAFMQERVAFFFGYSYHIPLLRTQAPGLRWEVAEIPQADAQNNKINFANYWVETVSKKSQNSEEAWNFLQFASSSRQVPKYLTKTGKPTALRSLVEEQKNDPVMAPFANQLLTAQSWYRGNDAPAAEAALQDMVNAVLLGENEVSKIVNDVVKRINATIN
jgi:multiple sugar transport system substrate-binding protein